MRREESKKVARLRSGESKTDDVGGPAAEPDLDTLGSLRRLDEQLEEAGDPAILDIPDRQIVDAALKAGRISYATLAAALGVHRSTVLRRVQRLLDRAPELHRRARKILGKADPQNWCITTDDWRALTLMMKTYAWGGVGDPPEGVLDLADYNKLAAMYRGGADARRLLYPPIDPSIEPNLERRGDKLIITGPLPPDLADLVRAGKAVHISTGPLRCLRCGRLISRPATGRPPKYCSERCRSRYRRQS